MKKQLLSILTVLSISTLLAQVPSPSWTISQNASFSITSAGHRFLDVVNANVVWLAGYNGVAPGQNVNWFSRTINGGTSYNSGNIYSDTNTYQLANLEGVDANTAWASAFMNATSSMGAIHKTTNGGATWTNMTAPGMYTNSASFTDFVSFLTPNNGVTVGDPVNGEFEIWNTTNGGTSWTQVPGANIPNPIAGEYGIVDLYCKQGTTNYWFGTQKGRVYRSTDAGLTWNATSLGAITSTVVELAFADANNGIIYAQGASGLEVYNTNNGGLSYNLISPTPANLGRNDVCGIPGTSFFASVDNQNMLISYSTNNGLTWTDWGSTGIGYTCIDFASSSIGWSGSFSDQTNASVGGLWKYNGATFNSVFSIPVNVCKTAATVTISPVNGSTGTGTLSYAWSASPAGVVFTSPTSSVPVVTFSNTGSYTLILTVTSAVGTSTSSQIINVLNCMLPVPSFTTPSNVCNNVPFTLNNTSTGSPLPGISVSIMPASGTTVSPIVGNQTVSIKVSAPGTYSITLVASSITGSAAVTQTILVKNCSPAVTFTVPLQVCDPTETIQTVNTTTAIGAFSYTWSINPQAGITMFSNVGNNKKISFDFTISSYTLSLTAANASGTNSAQQIITVAPCGGVGLSEKSSLENSFFVFPNPAHDQINLTLPNSNETYKIKMVNVIGAKVFEEKVSKNSKENYSINVSNKSKGVYFITVESATEKVTKKIIVD